jgi:hypothetical protein
MDKKKLTYAILDKAHSDYSVILTNQNVRK